MRHLTAIIAAVGLGPLQVLAGTASWDFKTDPETGPNPLTLIGSGRGTPDFGGAGQWIEFYGANQSDTEDDGFLSITGPTGSQWSKIFFPDIDDGAVIKAFTFECMLRIGNGSNPPADGFSLNYARAGDPTFTKDGSGNYQAGGWSGTVSEPGSTGGSMAGLAEEGTITGLAIGFDAWLSNSALWPADLNPGINDIIGISVRVDNACVAQVALPTVNGQCDDITSLQTGPISEFGADDWEVLCWQPFKVELTEDGHLSIWWKNNLVVDNLEVDFSPSAGQLVFGGRTGGSWQNQHIDEIVLTTIPAVEVLVGPATADGTSVSVRITDSGSAILDPDTVTMSIDGGEPVTADGLDFLKVDTVTTVRWESPDFLTAGADLAVEVTCADTRGVGVTQSLTATVSPYTTLPPEFAVASVDTGQPGFLMRPYQTAAEQPNTLRWTEEQLLGLHGPNIANLAGATDGFFTRATVINFNMDTAADVGNFAGDEMFPGFPGTVAAQPTGSSTEEVLTYIEFPEVGLYHLGVNSDDGFRVTASRAPGDLTGPILGYYDGGRGSSDTIFDVAITEPGFYPIRLIWENGRGELPGNGANLEFFSQSWDGVKTLINDTLSPDALLAYRASTADGPWVSNVSPIRGTGALWDLSTIMAEINHGSVQVDDSTVKLMLDGTEMAHTTTTAAGKTTVTAQLPDGQFVPSGTHTVRIEFSDTGAVPYSVEWQFTTNYQLYQAPYGPGGTWNLYLVNRATRLWVDAETAARTIVEPLSGQNKAGHLVSFHSEDENDFVARVAGNCWIGLTDNENYGGVEGTTWVWVSGEANTYENWNRGEPNNSNGEDAVEITGDGVYNDNGIGFEGQAMAYRTYVVEFDTRATEMIAGVAYPGLREELYQAPYGAGGTWNLYRVVREGRLWVDAKAKAETFVETASGQNKPGHLVTLHSAAEADFVMRIANGQSVWIGLTDNEAYGGVETGSDSAGSSQVPPTQGAWVWVTGEAYTWARWNSGEPNDWNQGNPGEDAVEMTSGGGFNDNGIGNATESWAFRDYVVEFETQSAEMIANVPYIFPPGPAPGPEGDGNFGIRVVRDVGNVGNIFVAGGALYNPYATIIDTTAPVVNCNDLDGSAGGGGIFGGDVDLPGNRPGNDDDLMFVAKGRLLITEAGDYTFGVHSDDGFALRVGGQPWISENGGGAIDPGDPTVLVYYTGTGDANTRGVINLPAGEVDLEFLWFEDGGGAYAELYAAKGAYTCDVDTANWRLVGTVVQPGATVAIPGVSTDGWTVEYSEPGGTGLNSIAEAEAELAGAATVSNVLKIQYTDPEAGGGRACAYPFPGNTAAADDDFAIRGTATLVIPADGTYHFGFQGDDGGYLQIEGQTWDSIVATSNADYGIINGDRIQFDVNTGNSYTVGAITLAEGTYTIRTLFWERGGGAWHWVFGGPPSSPLYAPIMADAAGVIPEPAMPFVGGAVAPTISIGTQDGNVVITFTGSLESADEVTGPWSDEAGTGQVIVSPTGEKKFYRSKQ